jgi:OOP family OmpA-OmpF porin
MGVKIPVVLAIAMLLAGIALFAPAIDPGAAGPSLSAPGGPVLEPPRLVFDRRMGNVLLRGAANSSTHEARLLRLAREQFPDSVVETDLRPGIVFPDYWEAASVRLLQTLAATESAVATLEPGQARVRGVTSDPDALASQLATLSKSLPADAEVIEDVAIVGRSTTLEELCRTNFANAITGPVSFRQSSAELRTSSHALLDAVIDVANDCRSHRLAIIGHTDASGNEDWNLALSVARAEAVADYLVRGGIQAQRLIVEGAGSAVPVADNATAYGRARNRRIEFELR